MTKPSIGRSSAAAGAVALVLVFALAACQPAPERPTTAAPPVATKQAPAPIAPPPVATPPAAVAPKVVAAPRSLDEYKRTVAARILQANAAKTFEGRPPHFLNAIVVLEITMDPAGRPTRVNVMRTPPHARHLGKVASDTVRAAGPFLAPPAEVIRAGRQLVFTETWLFRDDEKFQIRSLAQEQQ